MRLGTLLLALTLSAAAMAQVGERRTDLALGINGGWVMNKMDFQPTIKQNMKGGATMGVTARFICEKYFATICGVQAELNYTPLGWQELIEDGSGNTYSRTLGYIQLPLLMHMGWGREEKGLKFVFELGPQLGYNISSTENYGGGVWNPANRPNNVTGQYGMDVDNKLDYGITGGVGLELSTGIGHFILTGRYYYGLGDCFDNSKKGYFSKSSQQTISVKLTYLKDIIKTKH